MKYRPSYPAAVVDYLVAAGILTAESVVADIGSGTGLLTELFVGRGNVVYGVEPNAEMRAAGEAFLSGRENFRSICGTAEATTLEGGSIDLIIAGQAFHWFDRTKAREEFVRVLKGGGHVALIWNERLDNTPFLRAYEEVVKAFSLDYSRVDHRQITESVVADFFSPSAVSVGRFANQQVFDREGLEGRLRSSSYMPEEGDVKFEQMMRQVREIFAAHAEDGRVRINYETKMYVGQLKA